MQMDRASLYNLERQRMVQEPIDPSRGDWVLPFFYPPFFAVALVPLAWLPFSTAFVVMTLINLALLASAITLLVRKLELSRRQCRWLLLATFCNYGVHYAFLEAQTSFIALFCLAVFVTALNDSAANKAGVWSSLLSFKPQLALVPLFIMLVRRKWRALGVAAIIMGLFALISFAAIGREGISHYLLLSRRAMAGDEHLHIQPEGMHNLRALTYFFFSAPWRDYVWWLTTLSAMALIVLHSVPREPPGIISITGWISILVVMILVAPHLHSHDLTLLIVPSAFFLKRLGDTVPPFISLMLVALGILPLINTVAYPHLPPLLPLVLVIFLIIELGRTRTPAL